MRYAGRPSRGTLSQSLYLIFDHLRRNTSVNGNHLFPLLDRRLRPTLRRIENDQIRCTAKLTPRGVIREVAIDVHLTLVGLTNDRPITRRLRRGTGERLRQLRPLTSQIMIHPVLGVVAITPLIVRPNYKVPGRHPLLLIKTSITRVMFDTQPGLRQAVLKRIVGWPLPASAHLGTINGRLVAITNGNARVSGKIRRFSLLGACVNLGYHRGGTVMGSGSTCETS